MANKTTGDKVSKPNAVVVTDNKLNSDITTAKDIDPQLEFSLRPKLTSNIPISQDIESQEVRAGKPVLISDILVSNDVKSQSAFTARPVLTSNIPISQDSQDSQFDSGKPVLTSNIPIVQDKSPSIVNLTDNDLASDIEVADNALPVTPKEPYRPGLRDNIFIANDNSDELVNRRNAALIPDIPVARDTESQEVRAGKPVLVPSIPVSNDIEIQPISASRAILAPSIPISQDVEIQPVPVPRPVLTPDIPISQDLQEQKYVIPLDGKLITSSDAALVGKNFTILTNMRYTDNHPEGITGMVAINGTAGFTDYPNPRSAFHFQKFQPAESHVLVQTFNTDATTSIVIESRMAVPYAGTHGTAGTTGVFWGTALGTDGIWGGMNNTVNKGIFSEAPNGQVAYCNGNDTAIWGGNEMKVGAFIHHGSYGIAGTGGTSSTAFSYDYTDVVNSSGKRSFLDLVTITSGTDGISNFRVGATRPLQGVKFYVQTANGTFNNGSTSGTSSVTYWDGTAGSSVSNLVDTTKVGGLELAQTGSLSWDPTWTVGDDSKTMLRYLEGLGLLYTYDISFSGLASNTQLSYVTADAPMSQIRDLWDGAFRSVASFYIFTTTRQDNTLNVHEDSYDAADATTYASISGLTNSQYLEVGFSTKQTALLIEIPAAFTNSTVSTVISIDYWNGQEYKTVGAVTDGTAEGGISLAKPGVVSWANANSDVERQLAIADGMSLYYYRIKFDQTLDASVRIYFIGGAILGDQLTGYSFPLFANDRLMLGCGNFGRKNSIRMSAKYAPDVYNGIDTYDLDIGDEKSLTCGAPLFAQYNSNLFNMVMLFKDSETWVLIWTETATGTDWDRFRISPSIGCPAPRTLKTASVYFEKNLTQAKVVCIWRAHNGIYISNGQPPLLVSEDIQDVFDQSKPTHVNLALIESEYSFIDMDRMEWHWLWGDQTATTTLNREYVLDLKRWKWFEISRGSGNELQLGVSVADTDGNQYTYGFRNNGVMTRLERAPVCFNTGITATMKTGDQIPIPQDLLSQTRITRVNLVAVSKCTNGGTDGTIGLTHFIDGGTSGSSYYITDVDLSHRFANNMAQIGSSPGIFHSFQLSRNTTASTKGMEPMYLAYYYTKERDYIK